MPSVFDGGVFPEGAAALRAHGERLAEWLRRHAWLIRAKQVDFLCEEHWERLVPPDWAAPLEELPEQELRQLPTELPISPEWPEGLRDYVRGCRELAMSRGAPHPAVAQRAQPIVDATMARSLSDKKRHEVGLAVGLIAAVAAEAPGGGVGGVVDVGAGRGYLPTALAHGELRFAVAAVEAREHNLQSAAERDRKVGEAVAKRARRQQSGRGAERDTLWLGTLPPDPTEGAVAELCGGPAAGVVRVRLCGKSARPQACVLFSSPEAAAAALDTLRRSGATAAVARHSLGEGGAAPPAAPAPPQPAQGSPRGCAGPAAGGSAAAERGAVRFVRAFISDRTEASEFAALAADSLPPAAANSMLLCGLHACSALAAVGCCYYKAPWADPEGRRFPASEWGRSPEGHSDLDLCGARLACESAHRWAHMPTEEWEKMKRHTMDRVVLEVIARTLWPTVGDRIVIRSVAGSARRQGFAPYAVAALKGARQRRDAPGPPRDAPADVPKAEVGDEPSTAPLPAPVSPLPDEAELTRQHDRIATPSLWARLRAWLTLQQCIAPCAEAYFVLDRLVALHERLPGVRAAAVPAFAHAVSHRNVAIVAVRRPG
eukprot:TRINITY_DN36547_c0_g1_i1.p1 TRINITY_DN36547_c0_g1~~TRINITY_DN36547_c0_g1_i1.p1  ORF type:complete len:601 (+),score=123.68 TRINITY_DN36547_c0_g1_i1:77-1879(+)